MKQWRIASSLNGRFSPRINYGATAFWCAFDYQVSYDSAVDTFMVLIPQAVDAATMAWLPHLRQGIQACWQELADEGVLITGLVVTIEQLETHPTDTTSSGCRYYGAAFLSWLFRNYAVPS